MLVIVVPLVVLVDNQNSIHILLMVELVVDTIQMLHHPTLEMVLVVEVLVQIAEQHQEELVELMDTLVVLDQLLTPLKLVVEVVVLLPLVKLEMIQHLAFVVMVD